MTVVVGFEFCWWDAAEFVEDASVVEPVNPFEGGEFEVIETAPWSFVADEFGACSRASKARSVLSDRDACQPTMRRLNTSAMNET